MNCPVTHRPPNTVLTQASFPGGCVRHPRIHAGVIFSLFLTPSLMTRPFLGKELTPTQCRKVIFRNIFLQQIFIQQVLQAWHGSKHWGAAVDEGVPIFMQLTV